MYSLLVAQMIKNLGAVWETQVWSLVWEDLLEKRMATYSIILENSMDRGAWWATVPGVEKSQMTEQITVWLSILSLAITFMFHFNF